MNQKQMLELHKMVSDLRDEVAQMRDLIKGMTTPLDTKQSLPDPPAEIHLPQVLSLRELHDLLCDYLYAFIGDDLITEFKLYDDEFGKSEFLQVHLESGGYYVLQGSSERVDGTIKCHTRRGTPLQIDLTPNPTA